MRTQHSRFLLSNSQLRRYCGQVFRDILEVVLGINCGHAARPGGGDRLAVDVVLDVAAGEDTGHARLRTVVSDDVAV